MGKKKRKTMNKSECLCSIYPLLLAGAFFHEVRVVILSVDPAIRNDECKSIVHQTSAASFIEYCVAVDQFLLG